MAFYVDSVSMLGRGRQYRAAASPLATAAVDARPALKRDGNLALALIAAATAAALPPPITASSAVEHSCRRRSASSVFVLEPSAEPSPAVIDALKLFWEPFGHRHPDYQHDYDAERPERPWEEWQPTE